MVINEEIKGDVIILSPDTIADFEDVVILKAKLQNLQGKKEIKIIMDMRRIIIISYYAIGMFVACARELREKNGDIKFYGLQLRVRQAFSATRIDKLLNCFETEEEAIKSFN